MFNWRELASVQGKEAGGGEVFQPPQHPPPPTFFGIWKNYWEKGVLSPPPMFFILLMFKFWFEKKSPPLWLTIKYKPVKGSSEQSSLSLACLHFRSLYICPFWPAIKNWFWPVSMERSKARAYIFPVTTLQIPTLWPTGAGELSGSDP